jgi:hypothetical protein
MSRRSAILTGVAVIVFWPVWARADAGTPLVWGSVFHLLLGNALIGLFEGWLLARVFHLPKRHCIWLLILANYLSAWIGVTLTSYLFHEYATDIYSGWRVTWMLVAATYFLTLVVEWPFVALCFRKAPQWLPSSIKGSLLIQSASYLLLFGGYWLLSDTSLYTGMQVVTEERMSAPNGVVIFFISSADGDVYRSKLGSPVNIKVAQLSSTNYYDDHLELRDSEIDSNRWDIAAVLERRQSRVVVPSVSSKQQISDKEGWKTSQYHGWGIAPFQVGEATNSAWHLGWAHWPEVGMWARNGSRTVRIAYGTPFGGYTPYRVIHLPGEKGIVAARQPNLSCRYSRQENCTHQEGLRHARIPGESNRGTRRFNEREPSRCPLDTNPSKRHSDANS